MTAHNNFFNGLLLERKAESRSNQKTMGEGLAIFLSAHVPFSHFISFDFARLYKYEPKKSPKQTDIRRNICFLEFWFSNRPRVKTNLLFAVPSFLFCSSLFRHVIKFFVQLAMQLRSPRGVWRFWFSTLWLTGKLFGANFSRLATTVNLGNMMGQTVNPFTTFTNLSQRSYALFTSFISALSV